MTARFEYWDACTDWRPGTTLADVARALDVNVEDVRDYLTDNYLVVLYPMTAAESAEADHDVGFDLGVEGGAYDWDWPTLLRLLKDVLVEDAYILGGVEDGGALVMAGRMLDPCPDPRAMVRAARLSSATVCGALACDNAATRTDPAGVGWCPDHLDAGLWDLS